MDASNIMKTLVGDAGMYSTGGPGKGMTRGRMLTSLDSTNHWVCLHR